MPFIEHFRFALFYAMAWEHFFICMVWFGHIFLYLYGMAWVFFVLYHFMVRCGGIVVLYLFLLCDAVKKGSIVPNEHGVTHLPLWVAVMAAEQQDQEASCASAS